MCPAVLVLSLFLPASHVRSARPAGPKITSCFPYLLVYYGQLPAFAVPAWLNVSAVTVSIQQLEWNEDSIRNVPATVLIRSALSEYCGTLWCVFYSDSVASA